KHRAEASIGRLAMRQQLHLVTGMEIEQARRGQAGFLETTPVIVDKYALEKILADGQVLQASVILDRHQRELRQQVRGKQADALAVLHLPCLVVDANTFQPAARRLGGEHEAAQVGKFGGNATIPVKQGVGNILAGEIGRASCRERVEMWVGAAWS